MRVRPSLALLLLASGCAEPPPAPSPAPSASALVTAPTTPSPPANAEGTVARVAAPADVPLQGPRVEARAGDWLIRNAGSVAVISAAKGRVVDYGAEGGPDGIYYVEALAFDGLARAHVEVERVEPAGAHALYVRKRVLERPLTLHTWLYFVGPSLRIESMLTAEASSPGALAMTLGEQVGWGNTPTWMDGQGFVTVGGTFHGDFLAREAQGLGYAYCSLGGRLAARFAGPDAPGYHEPARTGEDAVTIAPGGSSPRRVVALTHGQSMSDAVLALPCLADRPRTPVTLPEGVTRRHPANVTPERVALPPGTSIEVARCAKEPPASTSPPKERPAPKPWLRFPRQREIQLPPGCFVTRFVAPGHAPGAWFSATSTRDEALLPKAGELRWSVTDAKGAPLPAKLLLRGLAPTPDPNWGDDPDDGAALNLIHTLGEGRRAIPPGRYRVSVQRGPEYSVDEREIRVEAGKTVDLRAKLDRVVDTAGWISADLHVHAMPSFDAPTPLEERVRSLAAVNVEVAVATDHNAVTDYAPAIRALKMEPHLASIVGDEVTSKETFFGHFNVFPLPAGTPALPYEDVPPKRLFPTARAAAPKELPFVIQVNHPRMGDIGYFDLLHLDTDDLAGWSRRATLADMDFDALEVFNGDDYSDIPKVERALRDFYALIDAGHRVVATGNSDSHKAAYQEAGVPRNWVLVPNDDPAALDPRAFLDALKAGRVMVSSGPFLRLRANGQEVGGKIPAGPAEITIEVQAPPWVDVDRVQLVRRGEVLDEWTGPFTTGVKRFAVKVTEPLAKGDWILAIARGSRPMTQLSRGGAAPFAFTNPIRVE